MGPDKASEVEAALIDAYPEASDLTGGRASDERGLMHAKIIERYEERDLVQERICAGPYHARGRRERRPQVRGPARNSRAPSRRVYKILRTASYVENVTVAQQKIREAEMRRRTFLTGSAAALALPSIVRAEKQTTLRFVPYADLAVLDPIWTTATVTRNHGWMVFDTLYGQAGPEQGFRVSPQMLAGHVVEDAGRVWRLTLRDGLVFHDGERVLGRDCVASIRRWGARDSLGETLLRRTADLSAPDDRTVQFRLDKPFAQLPMALGKTSGNPCFIMPERLAATDPFTQIKEMVGSGPFCFKTDQWTPGTLCAYERFDVTGQAPTASPTGLPDPKLRISIA